MYTVCCEAIYNNHKDVFRSALVGIGERPNQKPVIIIEPHKMPQSQKEKESLNKELLELGKMNPLTRGIDTVLFHNSFPVDIRHNAKIFLEKLALWARSELERL